MFVDYWSWDVDSWYWLEYPWVCVYHFSFEDWECWSVDDARSSDVVGSHSTIMEDVGGDDFLKI